MPQQLDTQSLVKILGELEAKLGQMLTLLVW